MYVSSYTNVGWGQCFHAVYEDLANMEKKGWYADVGLEGSRSDFYISVFFLTGMCQNESFKVDSYM